MAELTAEQRAVMQAWRIDPDKYPWADTVDAFIAGLRAAGFAIIPLEPDEDMLTAFGMKVADSCPSIEFEACQPETCVCRRNARAAYRTIVGGADG